ncbi:MAG: hypothetical protein ACMVO5_05055 [Polymorphobacter sp.]|uniref:bestrophin-like domain n=1 Tax=Polymorphobacter sp. TaxID=1909290 RepID=UPI003A8BC817
MTDLQNILPLWVLTLLFAAVLLASVVIGSRLRAYVTVDPATAGSGQLLIGLVTVLSLLLGFTFSLALNRHDQRRDLLLEEANAIQALHRTLVHVAQPGRAEIGTALHAYTRGRLMFVQSNLFAQAAQLEARQQERARLNAVVAKVVPRSDTGVTQAQILIAATRILDAGARMDMMSLEHVPARVVLVLHLLSTGAALVIGISIGEKLRGLWLPTTIWSLLLSLVRFTIVDLDTSQWGSIRLNRAPLENAARITADNGA